MPNTYPWYKVVRADTQLEQGDIFFNFPIYVPRYTNDAQTGETVTIDEESASVIVLSQSCDLLKMNRTDGTVVLCPMFDIPEQIQGGKMSESDWEPMVKEEIVASRIINQHQHRWHSFNYQRVVLKQIYTVPYSFLKVFKGSYGTRVRLLPPYREHLAQAFAKQFMRVGLPHDLPRTFPATARPEGNA